MRRAGADARPADCLVPWLMNRLRGALILRCRAAGRNSVIPSTPAYSSARKPCSAPPPKHLRLSYGRLVKIPQKAASRRHARRPHPRTGPRRASRAATRQTRAARAAAAERSRVPPHPPHHGDERPRARACSRSTATWPWPTSRASMEFLEQAFGFARGVVLADADGQTALRRDAPRRRRSSC